MKADAQKLAAASVGRDLLTQGASECAGPLTNMAETSIPGGDGGQPPGGVTLLLCSDSGGDRHH